MKTDKNFRLNKTAKRILSTISDKTEYSFYKESMIDSQLTRDRTSKINYKKQKDEE